MILALRKRRSVRFLIVGRPIVQQIDRLGQIAPQACDRVRMRTERRQAQIGDADAPKSMRPKIWAICDRYGDRDHLRSEIATYLISIGRRSPFMFDA